MYTYIQYKLRVLFTYYIYIIFFMFDMLKKWHNKKRIFSLEQISGI